MQRRIIIFALLGAVVLLLCLFVLSAVEAPKISHQNKSVGQDVAASPPPTSEISAMGDPTSARKPETLADAVARAQEAITKQADNEGALAAFEACLGRALASELIAAGLQSSFDGPDVVLLHAIQSRFAAAISPGSFRILLEAYDNCNDELGRETLAGYVVHVRDPKTLDTFEEFIATRSASLSASYDPLVSAVSQALISSQDPNRLEAVLNTAARADDRAQASLLAYSLPLLNSPSALPLLTDVLNGNKPILAAPAFTDIAIALISQIKTEQARDLLAKLVESPDSAVANKALEAQDALKRSAPTLYGSEQIRD